MAEGEKDPYVAELERVADVARGPHFVFDTAVKLAYPHITWDRPITVTRGASTGLACRLCIARNGLKHGDGNLFENIDAWLMHVAEVH